MAGTIKMFCIRMNILTHRNNIVLFLACNMATMQYLCRPFYRSIMVFESEARGDLEMTETRN